VAVLAFPADLVDEAGHVNLSRANNFGQDREVMRSGSFTGLRTTLTEDAAMQVSMGSLYDHDREIVVPADRAVLKARRLLVESARRVQMGKEPLGLRAADAHSIRAVEALADDATPWQHFVKYDGLMPDDEQPDDEQIVLT
jgi:phthalate 4,5-dioxygenase oxygenase subunit